MVDTSGKYMFLASAMFSLCTACAKGAGKRVPTFEKVFVRSVFNTLLCFRGSMVDEVSYLSLKQKICLFLRGSAGFIALYAYFEGTQVLPLGTLTLISRFHPVLSSIAGGLFLGEKLYRHQFWTLFFALVGVGIIANPSFGQASFNGVLVALVAAIFTAVAFTFVRYLVKLGTPQHLIVLSFHSIGVPFSLLLGYNSFVVPNLKEGLWLAGSIVFMQFGQYFMTKLLGMRTLANSASSSFLIVVWNSCIGLIMGDDWPSLSVLVGFAFIILPISLGEIYAKSVVVKKTM